WLTHPANAPVVSFVGKKVCSQGPPQRHAVGLFDAGFMACTSSTSVTDAPLTVGKILAHVLQKPIFSDTNPRVSHLGYV
ncbi:MAG: hypothetical protein ACYS0H_30570, partial [Planctomycetota bacterium]